MSQPQKNTILVLAIVAGLISLPLPWMTIRGAQLEGGLGELFNSTFPEFTLTITGLDGYVNVLFKSPIWVIVITAIAASVLQLMHSSRMFSVPRLLVWLVTIVAFLWMCFPAIAPMLSDRATIHVGTILGLICAIVPLLVLIVPTSPKNASTSDTAEANGQARPNRSDG